VGIFLEEQMKHIDKVLASVDWEEAWKEVGTSDSQTRKEDDSYSGSITVVFSVDGDAWIGFNPDPEEFSHRSFRFRTSGGGGRSLRVRKALMVLAMAIKADNEDDPIRRDDGEDS